MNMTKTSFYSKKMLLLVFSITLNLILAYHILIKLRTYHQLSWSLEAALEAEAVGREECSGHGRAYLDGNFVGNGKKPACECNACFTGSDCSLLNHGCVLDADSGDPIFLEPFWRQHAAASTIVVPGWHRMSYEYEGGSLISQYLEKQIRRLHDNVGNAITKDKFIVFGLGATQLLNAAVHALSHQSSSLSSSTKVVASSPYYPVYKTQTKFFKSKQYNFQGDVSSWKSQPEYKNFIEFVTSPNNPDGQLKKAVLEGPKVKTIHDLAYYWPHYTPIPSKMDEDLMLFTLSKITGHAGSRFGWAIIKDKSVYERMLEYIDLNTYGVPRETQLRASKLLSVILGKGKERKIFEFGDQTMRNRWKELSYALSMSTRFSLQELSPFYCTFWKKVKSSSPAFAWIKCLKKDENDCYEVLRTANITGRRGRAFDVENRYVRLSLVKSQDDFDLLLRRIQILDVEEKNQTFQHRFVVEENKVVPNKTFFEPRILMDHTCIEFKSLKPDADYGKI